MTGNEDLRAYLHDMVEQFAELARNEGLTQGAAYLALAGMALRDTAGVRLEEPIRSEPRRARG